MRIESATDRQASGWVRGSAHSAYRLVVRVPEPAPPGRKRAAPGRLRLAPPDPTLRVGCSCPHFARGSCCKHLWAFFLALETTERVPEVPGSGAIELEEVKVEERPAPDPSTEDRAPSPRDPRAWWLLQSEASAASGRRSGPPIDRTIYYVLALERARPGSAVDVRLFEPVGSGSEKRLKPFTSRPEDITGRWERVDEEALRALTDCAQDPPDLDPDPTTHRSSRPFHVRAIAPGLQPLVLPLLARTGRLCRLPRGRPSTAPGLIPLRWDAERAYGATPRLVSGGAAADWQLVAELEGPDAPDAAETEAVFGNGLALVGDRILRIEPPELASFVEGFRRQGPISISSDELPDFLERATERALPPIELPEQLGWSRRTLTPHGCLRIQEPMSRAPGAWLGADVVFVYEAEAEGDDGAVEERRSLAPRSFEAHDPRAGFVDRESRRIFDRDPDRERALWQELLDEGLEPSRPEARGEGELQLDRSRLSDCVARLIDRGWQVEAEGVRLRSPSTSRASVRTGVDWFDLEGEVVFGDQRVALPELLIAARAGGRTVRLDDGSLGLLPSEWLARLAPLAELAEANDGPLRFRPSQALLLDTLLAAQPEIDVDAAFEKACRRLERIGEPQPAPTPEGVRARMRPYQQEGLGWLLRMSEIGMGACLADDMGLGKTLQTLALLVARRRSREAQDEVRQDEQAAGRTASDPAAETREPLPSLVVVPASLVQSWLDEAARFTPELVTLAYTGPHRARLRDAIPEADLVVTTYATLRRDAAKLADRPFDCVILDEAQAIKNAQTQVSKAARLLRARQRIALSGTPVENHLGELWALFDFLNPGLLGPRARRARSLADADDETVGDLARSLAPFILRRTKAQVLTDLPPKTEQTIHCTLVGRERRLYQELRDHYRTSLLSRVDAEGLGRSRIHVLEALLRLRQTACHPGLVDPSLRQAGSAKLDALFQHLEPALDEGHKALVFSQFTTLLGLVRERLDEAGIRYAYLDGRTRNRGECVRRFQEDPGCRVFLVSLKAGGQGLNLTAADFVFLLDPWWNPAVEAQAIDRVHRIGQTRPVFAYRIVSRDTVEEKILELQESKRQLADAIVSGASNGLRDLSREDLERLLE